MVLVLIALAILLPMAVGIALGFIKEGNTRKYIVLTSGALLVVVSGLFILMKNSITLPLEIYIQNESIGTLLDELIKILDIALMLAIMFIGARYRKISVMTLTILQLVPAVIFEFFMVKHSERPQALFLIDNLSMILLLLVSIIGPLITVFAIGYMKEHDDHQNGDKHQSDVSNQHDDSHQDHDAEKLHPSTQPRFFMIMFIFLGAMNALALSNNLMWMYFFWEVTTLCSFLLISHDKNEISIKNAFRALWMNLLGGIAFVAAIILLYKETGTFYINEILELSQGGREFLLLPLGLLCFAGLTKSAQFPFQGWLLGAMVAPTPVSALLHSSTMVKAGVYLVVRFAPVYSGTILGKIVAVAGAFTFLAGSAIAISQSNSKRVLAYSTIANLGLIICCAGIGSPVALGAAVLLIIFHAVSKALLFLCVGTIEHGIGSRDIEDMQGLMKKMPLTTVITVIGMISMLLPPFGVLVTKWLAIEAAVRIPMVLIMIVLGSAFTVVFWSKWIGIILTMSYRTRFKREKLAPTTKFTLLTLLTGVMLASLAIVPLYNYLVEPQMVDLVNHSITDLEGLKSGMWLFNGNSPVGGFESIPLFFILLGLFSLIPLALSKVRPESIRPPYLCGENTADRKGLEFTSISDKASPVMMHNYYLSGVFGEGNLTIWANLIAVAVILIMFGVSV